jgi:hypothetical protein
MNSPSVTVRAGPLSLTLASTPALGPDPGGLTVTLRDAATGEAASLTVRGELARRHLRKLLGTASSLLSDKASFAAPTPAEAAPQARTPRPGTS